MTADDSSSSPQTPLFFRILSWVVAILALLALILTSVRILLTPWFVQVEYRTPNFPPDPFGFTQADRLHWSEIDRIYLLNDDSISFLGDLKFADGSPLYNERELQHMVDVKNVVGAALKVWLGSLLGLVALGIWAWFGRWWSAYRLGLSRGGWITVFFVAVIIPLVLVSFGVLFVFFHEIFFASGTWIFRYSDTLIRLFPERFWRDAFLAIGLLSLAGGLALGFGFRKKK